MWHPSFSVGRIDCMVLSVYSRHKKSLPGLRRLVALGDDLLSHLLQAVPSARPVLTSLFGMGRGVPRRYRHRNLSARHCGRVWVDKRCGRSLAFNEAFCSFSEPSGKFRVISTARLCHRWLYTCGLSTSSSVTTLERSLILRRVSHLDAFSAYLVRT